MLSQGTGCLQVIQLLKSPLLRRSKNTEGGVSCGGKCAAALTEEAGGIGGAKVPFLRLNKAPTSRLRGRVGTDVGFQHFIYFYNPSFSRLPLQDILEAKTDTCQDVRCPDKIRMILSKAEAEGNQLQPLQRSKGQLGLGLQGWAIPRCRGLVRCHSRHPAHAPADAWHMTLGQLVAAKVWLHTPFLKKHDGRD